MSNTSVEKFVKIVDALSGAEGPVFTKDGLLYMVAPEVEIEGKPAGQVVNIDVETKRAEIICSPCIDGWGGIPAGCQSDKSGNLWIADMRLGLLKVNPIERTYKQITKNDISGRTLQGCNDCIFDYNGDLWVTAPAGNIAPAEYKRSFEEAFGSVYCYTKDGSTLLVDTGYNFSNGIAVKHTKDGKPEILIVAETPKKRLMAYDITGPGIVTNKREWAKLPGDHEGGPDGMDFDEEGNLLVANWGSSHIEVFGPEGGNPINRIKCPFQRPSNLHFKPKSNEVFVTEHDTHGLWMFQWKCKGKPQYCEL